MRIHRPVIAPEPLDVFARASRWPNRQHPRRDPEGHPNGGDPVDPPADPADPPADPPKDPADPPAEVDWKKEARKHEARAKENAKAAEELEKIRAKNRTAEEKAAKERDDANARAEAAEARAARADAARKYSLSDEDLELLDGVPADQFDAKAKKLSERIKAAAPAGRSGNDVGGGKPKPKPTTLDGAIGAHYSH